MAGFERVARSIVGTAGWGWMVMLLVLLCKFDVNGFLATDEHRCTRIKRLTRAHSISLFSVRYGT